MPNSAIEIDMNHRVSNVQYVWQNGQIKIQPLWREYEWFRSKSLNLPFVSDKLMFLQQKRPSMPGTHISVAHQ